MNDGNVIGGTINVTGVVEVKAEKVKRHYTPRGTTVLGKRVVLRDGLPVGRGRPAKAGKGKRTVVYVPVGESYDVAKHGTGTEYRASRHGVLRRLKVANKVINVGDGVKTEAVAVESVA